jgi:hypothetical protein
LLCERAHSETHRSARQMEAERVAADINAPKEVRRRAGKSACSPFKEVWR